eukprot:GHVN01031583.1.p1 GENE.GHVN01031583.1~~GHVN01031583.1.p1  ORF type:complete len:173 (+),score=14.83 GHVN01031583.1:239-757(+)
MGGQVSGCCGGSPKESQLEISAHTNKVPNGDKYVDGHSNTVPIQQNEENPDIVTAESQQFLEQMVHGIGVEVILQDKSKLKCQLSYRQTDNCLVLCSDNKTRSIALADVKSVLHSAEQLKRVETAAGILETDPCAAIHLSKTGNCIPVFFASMDEKDKFVEMVNAQKRLISG